MKITAIDIGESVMRAAVLRQGWSGSVVEACMAETIPDDNAECGMRNAGFSSSLVSCKHLIISLPRRYVFMKIIEMPPLKGVDLKKALEYEVEEHIPYSLTDVIYDFCVIRQAAAPLAAEKTRILLVAAPKAVVQSYLEKIGGIRSGDITVSVASLSLLNLCLSQEKERDWVLCCREEKCQEIFVVRDGCLSLVQTIQGQGIEEEIARLVQEYQVKKIIVSGEGSVELSGVIGARLPRSCSVEEFVLPDSIRIASQVKHLPVVLPPSPVPIALALNRLPGSTFSINLYPAREMQSKQVSNRQLRTGILLSLLMVFCMNLLFLVCIRRMEKALQLTRIEINKICPRVENIIGNKTSLEQLADGMKGLNEVILDTPDYLHTLNELTRLVSTGETRLESVRLKMRECLIAGHTSSVASLLMAIEKSPVFEQAELAGGIVKEMGLERFEIRMQVAQKAED